MPQKPTHPSFGHAPQDQRAAPAAPASRLDAGHTTQALAERHEALWLRLSALHNDTLALGAKKPNAPVSDALRISAESLLSDGAPFTRQRHERLPVAAPDLAGLAAQLGQALAGLEGWESRHTSWDERFKCRIWQLQRGYRPIMRLKPPAAALKFERTDSADMRDKLARRIDERQRATYQQGFAAGRAARAGEPTASPAARTAEGASTAGESRLSGADQRGATADVPQTYPRLRALD